MICIIPARAGSRRIPDKNIKEFKGRPIIEYSIRTAQKAGWEVCVSTDSEKCAQIAEHYGAMVIERPAHLAVDEVGTQAVAHHVVDFLQIPDPQAVCVLYATSPLLTEKELAIGFLIWRKFDDLCVYSADANGEPSGGFYIADAEFFRKEYDPYKDGYPSVTGDVDINDNVDWAMAEKLWDARHES